jgi:hypothetical protein
MQVCSYRGPANGLVLTSDYGNNTGRRIEQVKSETIEPTLKKGENQMKKSRDCDRESRWELGRKGGSGLWAANLQQPSAYRLKD